MTGIKKQTWPPGLRSVSLFKENRPSEIAVYLFPVFDLKNLDDKNGVMD